MKNLMIAAVLAVSLLSCKKETKNTETVADTRTEVPTEAGAEKSTSDLELGCYSYSENGNNITLEVTNVQGVVTGNLNYDCLAKTAIPESLAELWWRIS